jgi:hypothetical protein
MDIVSFQASTYSLVAENQVLRFKINQIISTLKLKMTLSGLNNQLI